MKSIAALTKLAGGKPISCGGLGVMSEYFEIGYAQLMMGEVLVLVGGVICV